MEHKRCATCDPPTGAFFFWPWERWRSVLIIQWKSCTISSRFVSVISALSLLRPRRFSIKADSVAIPVSVLIDLVTSDPRISLKSMQMATASAALSAALFELKGILLTPNNILLFVKRLTIVLPTRGNLGLTCSLEWVLTGKVTSDLWM